MRSTLCSEAAISFIETIDNHSHLRAGSWKCTMNAEIRSYKSRAQRLYSHGHSRNRLYHISTSATFLQLPGRFCIELACRDKEKSTHESIEEPHNSASWLGLIIELDFEAAGCCTYRVLVNMTSSNAFSPCALCIKAETWTRFRSPFADERLNQGTCNSISRKVERLFAQNAGNSNAHQSSTSL